MKIYTRTGDDGSTGLFGGQRVRKDDARVEAYGTVDELNSNLGVVRAQMPDEPRLAPLDVLLGELQVELFVVGADLATPRDDRAKPLIDRIEADAIERLEAAIDRFEADLPPLTSFILPGGSVAGASLHLARTVCRRAERITVAAVADGVDLGEVVVRYLNRLSDLLFVLGRWSNHVCGTPEVAWVPHRHKT